MIPLTLSASSIESYEGCPARFAAEMAKVRTDSEPGRFGTAMHAALDTYFTRILGTDGVPALDVHDPEELLSIWKHTAGEMLGWRSEWEAEGADLLERWATTRPMPAKVLSREIKETFDLVVPDGTVQKITYICDRIDEMPDGSIKVVDYKTQRANVTPTTLYRLIQPGLYSAAMRRKYGCEGVTVEYDMIRYGLVSVPYTATDLDNFERYLGSIAARIHADDEPVEKLNPKCNYCIRKAECTSLARAQGIGWTPSLPADVLVAIRANSVNAKKALETLIEEIDEALLAALATQDVDSFSMGDTSVGAKVKRIVNYDPEVVLRVLGDDAWPFIKVGKTALDKELKRKRGRFSPEQATEIISAAQESWGEPTLDIKESS